MPDFAKPHARESVEDHHFDSADIFLDKLRPRPDSWNDDPSVWIFRGQADANWSLRSLAVRESGKAFGEFGLPLATDWSKRSDNQNKLIERFRLGLDDAGLSVPTRDPRPEEPITSPVDPRLDLRPLWALARHHGLPTTLLDWSRRAWVAAYFAAEDAVRRTRTDRTNGATHIAVWALYKGHTTLRPERSLFYEAPSATNPNMRAQSGLFTKHMTADERSLEEYLVEEHKMGRGRALHRFTLPVSKAVEVLHLLAFERITAASMFPGADGVARAMIEKVWCEGPDA